jgi:Ca2+-binding RTX toxin-like protein
MHTNISDGFRHPLGNGVLTESNDGDGYYVAQDFDVYNPGIGAGSFHLGEDWNGEELGNSDLGDPVFSISNGEVVAAGFNSGFGNFLVIKHLLPVPLFIDGAVRTEIHSLYAHLENPPALAVGDLVDKGQQIGAIGLTGAAGGKAHLHFEIRLGSFALDDGYNPTGAPIGWVDPTDFINAHRTLSTVSISHQDSIVYVSDANARLVEWNQSTGAIRQIGFMPQIMTDIAMAPDGTLYGITYSQLFIINPATASTTFVANLGTFDAVALEIDAFGAAFLAGGANTNLYKVNLVTGALSVVGNTGFTAQGDLAFNRGQLFMATSSGSLATLDVNTGASIAQAAHGIPNLFGLTSGPLGLYGFSGDQAFKFDQSGANPVLDFDFSALGIFIGQIWGSTSSNFGQSGKALRGTAANDVIFGTDLDDVLFGFGGGDNIFAGLGDDTIDGDIGGDLISGDDGDDFILAQSGRDFVLGGAGDDKIDGAAGDDTVDGGGNNDRISGGTGFDLLSGGNGNDTIQGGTENDTLSGGKGFDYLIGQDGNDTLIGDDLADTLVGGNGSDFLNGGIDNDRLIGDAQHDTILGDAGDDIVDAGTGNDSVNGGGQRDSVFGGSGFDLIDGGAGNDTLQGGNDADTLNGGTGYDVLEGGDGDDVLDGGDLNDVIFGNAGNDTIIFRKTGDTDTIRDFTGGAGAGDVIRLIGFGTAFDSFAEVLAAATDNGVDTTIAFGGGDMIVLRGVLVSQLAADDFIFG